MKNRFARKTVSLTISYGAYKTHSDEICLDPNKRTRVLPTVYNLLLTSLAESDLTVVYGAPRHYLRTP